MKRTSKLIFEEHERTKTKNRNNKYQSEEQKYRKTEPNGIGKERSHWSAKSPIQRNGEREVITTAKTAMNSMNTVRTDEELPAATCGGGRGVAGAGGLGCWSCSCWWWFMEIVGTDLDTRFDFYPARLVRFGGYTCTVGLYLYLNCFFFSLHCFLNKFLGFFKINY